MALKPVQIYPLTPEEQRQVRLEGQIDIQLMRNRSTAANGIYVRFNEEVSQRVALILAGRYQASGWAVVQIQYDTEMNPTGLCLR